MRMRFIFVPTIIIFILLGFFYILNNFLKVEKKESIKSAATFVISSTTLTPTLSLTPVILPKKLSYSIAIFGDSMVDTMGEELEHLRRFLTNKYPQTKFNLYNYGIGGQNIEQGLARFESSFANKERKFPPVSTLSPDILIIGSFAYNPFPVHDKNKHYAFLKELLTKASTLSSRIYLMAEIAPLKTGFGKGKTGIEMTDQAAYEHVTHIFEQLDNAVTLSMTENVPLINVYHLSRIDGVYGDPYYVSPDDGIHPSYAGHSFTAEIIAQKIKLD